MGAWGAALGNTYISGGASDTNLDDICISLLSVGCMTSPPDGLGLPGRRTEDVVYAQRDGVVHFSDWYEPRIVTLAKVMVCDTGCGSYGSGLYGDGGYGEGANSLTAREKIRELLDDWARDCCDTELVIYSDHYTDKFDEFPHIDNDLTMVIENLHSNPSLETDDTGPNFNWDKFTGSGMTATASRQTSGGYVGTAFERATVTAPPASPDGGIVSSDAPIGDATVLNGSMWVRASRANRMNLHMYAYDASNAFLSDFAQGTEVVLAANTWTRLSVSGTTPANTEKVRLVARATSGTSAVNWQVADTIDGDAAMITLGPTLYTYFDGSSTDTDNPVVGGEKHTYIWEGIENLSASQHTFETYTAGPNIELNGPFGIVGRPRVAEVVWRGKGSSCAEVLLRFDGVDQRMYLLDECGTPGYSSCVQLLPSTSTSCRTYPRCYSGAGMCYDNPVGVVVPPTDVVVGGTEQVFPSITLYPGLTRPRIENVTNGEYILFAGTITGSPVEINTQDGTAFQDGESVTHLLRGSLFLSMKPGTYEWQMTSSSPSDDGYADLCWRDTVLTA